MRKTISLLLGITVVFSLAIGTAEAQSTINVKETISGSVVPLYADLNGDGIQADLGLCAGKGNLGYYTCKTVTDFDRSGAQLNTANCPGAFVVEIPLARGGSHVQMFKQGDLLFWVQDDTVSNYACLDLATNSWTMITHYSYTGGTGRFDGATGPTTMELAGQALSFDHAGNSVQHGTSGTVTGTIYLAK